MPRGAPSAKISITIAPDVHAHLVEAAAADATTVSAWITRAVEQRLAIASGLADVASWEADHGAFSTEELETARSQVRADLAAVRDRPTA